MITGHWGGGGGGGGVSSLDDVISDLYTIEEAAEQLGLSLNHSKSESVCSDPMVKREMLSVSTDFHSVDPADACLLGAPLGEMDSINVALKQKSDELKLMGERLQVLFSHDALCLLTDTFSLPKTLYLLRTLPCFCSTILDSLDSVQHHLLESICNVHLSDNAWLQASLLVKSGGLGIRNFATLAPSSFLASAAGSSDLTKAILPPSMVNSKCPFYNAAISLWKQGHVTDPPSGSLSGSRKAWDAPHISATVSHLMENTDSVSRGNLLASQKKESGAWRQPPRNISLGSEDGQQVHQSCCGTPPRCSTLYSPHSCA